MAPFLPAFILGSHNSSTRMYKWFLITKTCKLSRSTTYTKLSLPMKWISLFSTWASCGTTESPMFTHGCPGAVRWLLPVPSVWSSEATSFYHQLESQCPDAMESNMLPCFVGLLPPLVLQFFQASAWSPPLREGPLLPGCHIRQLYPPGSVLRASWDHRTQQAHFRLSSKAPLNGGWT